VDKFTFNRCKYAIRQSWQRSREYRELIDRADYTCSNCGKRYTNKNKLYGEHLKPIESFEYSTLEEYYKLMRNLDNIAVYGKECCRAQKDLQDRQRLKEMRKLKKAGNGKRT